MSLFLKIKKVYCSKKEIWIDLKKYLDLMAFRKEWRTRNCHNGTIAKNKFDRNKVKVGKGTYGELTVIGFDNLNERLLIGNYCSIAGSVVFLLGGEHPLHMITTFPYASHILHISNTDPTPTKGAIVVEDDVWICHGALILSGVTIGKGSVIGAGSIVTKSVPPYAIYVGERIIGYRFEKNIINRIKGTNLNKIQNLDKIKQKYILENEVTGENVEMIEKWLK